MSHYLARLIAVSILPLAVGCAQQDTRMWITSGKASPAVNERPTPATSAPTINTHVPETAPSDIPFPPAEILPGDAEKLLAGDPMALRFLAIRSLAARGLIPSEEAGARREANLGALLPLTAPTKPPTGLDIPIPPLAEIFRIFRNLEDPSHGQSPPAARRAEQDFLMDMLLPANPDGRMDLAPHDKVNARKVLERLGRLQKAGLIAADERAREAAAVENLMAGLPEVEAPPPPPEPPKKKKLAKSGQGGDGGSGTGATTRRLQGGVTGKLEIVPTPLSFDPPKLTAEFQGEAGAHLLSMATAAYADRAWQALTKQYPDLLGKLGYTVQRADLGDLGVTYRLIAGPMEPIAAERLCGMVRQQGQACMPTPFPAQADAAPEPAPAAPAAHEATTPTHDAAPAHEPENTHGGGH